MALDNLPFRSMISPFYRGFPSPAMFDYQKVNPLISSNILVLYSIIPLSPHFLTI